MSADRERSVEGEGGVERPTPIELLRGYAIADGEDVVFTVGQTRVRWLGHIVGAVVFLAVVYYLDLIWLGYYAYPDLFLTSVMAVATAAVVVRALVMWLRVRYVVTTHRLIVRGLFSVIAAVSLEDVTEVEVRTSTLGDLLGYDTVVVHTTGSSVRLPFVSSPEEVVEVIGHHGGA